MAAEATLLRFTTAGSVDDGKSTLIGRLLYDSKGVYEDQLASVRTSKINRGSGPIDFSLLTDGLKAEREQGITIDVAYRYFATAKRKFIIADTPGHEQYTRNMATGASTADLAVVLLDAMNGITTQSRRHACIAAFLGIRNVVVAVNKMDRAGFSRGVFEGLEREFRPHLERLGIPGVWFIPISALEGDNVVAPSERTPWYGGPSLLEYLEAAPASETAAAAPLRLPVQYVLRPDMHFRGYAGRIVSGTLRPGDAVLALPSGRITRVQSIPTYDGALETAFAPMSIAVRLEEELDISRGDMLVDPRNVPHVARRFEAKLVWMNERPLETGKSYLLKHTTQTVGASVLSLACRIDVNTLARKEAARLEMNDIGIAHIETSRPLFFDTYGANRATGSFILVDRLTNATVAAGMIEAAERGAGERRDDASLPAAAAVTPSERTARMGHHAAVIWLNGRQELASGLEAKLFALGCYPLALPDPGEALAEVAQALIRAGLIAIVSPAESGAAARDAIRALVGQDRFFEPDAALLELPAEEAVPRLCAALAARGIIQAVDAMNEGEGI
jgi:sulfate adenylyltransferase large subunit